MDLSSRFSGNGNGSGHVRLDESRNGAAVMEEPGNGNGHAVKNKQKKAAGMGSAETAEGASAERAGHSEGRDQAGRFAAGNKGGPGNPYSRHVANLKMWLSEVVDEEGVKEVGRALLTKARKGDVAASRVLFQYVMPKQVNPDRMNVEEWQLFKEDGTVFGELPGMMTKPGAELALQMVRAARPMATEKVRGMTANLLMTPQEKLGDVSEMLVADRGRAREYLETGKMPEKRKGKPGKR